MKLLPVILVALIAISSCSRNEPSTLVIFTSDNGPVWFEEDIRKYQHDSKAGLKGRRIDIWKGGSRVPFIASWRGKIPQETTSGQLLCFTDMMATFSAIVQDSINEKNYDSNNFLPVFLDPATNEPVRKELVIEDKIYMNGKWKFIDGSGLGGLSKRFDHDGYYLEEINNKGELYDLSIDLHESNNLFREEQEWASAMKTRLQEILANP